MMAKKSLGYSQLPSFGSRLRKRFICQIVISIWACAIIWVLVTTQNPLGNEVRNFFTSALSPENDWMPAIQEVISLNPEKTNDHEQMVLPVSGIVVKNFGWHGSDQDPTQKWHGGIDIKASNIQPIKAAAAGKVAEISGDPANGYSITIIHNEELNTLYGNLGEVLVKKGQSVKQGENIGEVGKSQVHFEIRVRGTSVDPLDYLRSNRNTI